MTAIAVLAIDVLSAMLLDWLFYRRSTHASRPQPPVPSPLPAARLLRKMYRDGRDDLRLRLPGDRVIRSGDDIRAQHYRRF